MTTLRRTLELTAGAKDAERRSKQLAEQAERIRDKVMAKDISNLRCPQCGDKVFVATISPDGWVMCRDMGHWAGPIFECEQVVDVSLTPPTHTLDDDFAFFLSRTGLGEGELPEVIAKMRVAYVEGKGVQDGA